VKSREKELGLGKERGADPGEKRKIAKRKMPATIEK
jgi:hypothetical protein